ncbi:MAG: class I SAM-dependent methyltransferase [Sedimentisphaerales bacterium]|nr:class I SAM-dependent methyltransferase [Sedimentisphaerales bacterium]
MKLTLLNYIACQKCGSAFELREAAYEHGEVKQGFLACAKCNLEFPITNFIPRFAEADNYAAAFGLQWNRFSRTQIDKYNGTTLSSDRFYRESGWSPTDLRGSMVLEAGCGAGRFTQACLDAGAEVVAFDLSNSVDACLQNHGLVQNLHIIQADIYNLPFKKKLFDRAFCFGVLQHTPDPEGAFASLVPYLRPDGFVAVDVYRKVFWNWLLPKYYFRFVSRLVSYPKLFDIVSNKMVPLLLPFSDFIGRIPRIGLYLRRILPVANIRGYAPLSEEVIRDWAVLDTFDMLAARYDQPQTATQIRRWFADAGLVDTVVWNRRTIVIGQGHVRSQNAVVSAPNCSKGRKCALNSPTVNIPAHNER